MNCLCDLKVFTVPNYVWPLNYNATFRPDLHEGMGLIVHGLKIECFSPTIEFNIQSHKIYYFYELNLSHVNLFGPSISPKSYLYLLFFKFIIPFTLPMQEFQFVFSFLLSHFLTFFPFVHFFWIFLFQLTLSTLTSFNFYISFPFIHFFFLMFLLTFEVP
jgi:hypothetical protein